ncbi:MAG: transglycosylase domain-containing protein, partial [Dehalococcoidia bacterium]|nr:transglycosylase domain-containing protein [Dehalococcoidia bacterium]
RVMVRRRRRRRGGRPNYALLVPIIVLSTLAAISLIAIIGAAGAATAVYSYYAKDLVDPETMASRDIARTTRILDRNGELLYEVFDRDLGRRTTVHLSEIPVYVKDATIATEDATFYENRGININGLARAVLQNVGGEGGGGSSITQQLVKNVLIPQEERSQRLYSRKIKESILAYELTRRYSKDQILEWYLNEISYGNLSFGIESAAGSYFGKTAKELTLAEAAMLVGIPSAPSYYSPLVNPKFAKDRQSDVLDLMVRQGYIDQVQAEAAKAEDLVYATQKFTIRAPHFVMYVIDLLEKKYGREMVRRGGLTVRTTIDVALQDQVEWLSRATVKKLASIDASNAAVVSIKPKTGEILVMLGSVDYFDSSIDGQVNVALADRQPGSSFKPITYITAFMKGYTPSTMILDIPTAFPDGVNPNFVPENNDLKFRGPVSARFALGNSLNIPAVKVLQFAGLTDVLATAHALGITTLTREGVYGLALTLGGGEVRLLDLTYVYSVFANEGVMAGQPVLPEAQRAGMRQLDPVAILKVVDDSGKVLEEYETPQTKEILPPEYVYLLTNVLSDNVARTPTYGSNSPLKLSDRQAAAKTGTTSDYRDYWTIGYTPELVTGVWVGNADNKPMKKSYSFLTAAAIWHDAMEAASDKFPPTPFKERSDIVKVQVCAVSGLLPTPLCPNKVTEVFIKGKEPKGLDNIYQSFRIDKTTGLLATSQTPPGNIEEKVFMVLPPEAADWARRNDIPQPPTEYSPVTQGEVIITAPAAGSYVSGKVSISGSARAANFAMYRLEYGEGTSPTLWTQIGSPVSQQITNTVLGQWDTSKLGGLYTLRLRVTDKAGKEQLNAIPVTVDNVPPTIRITQPITGTSISFADPNPDWVNIQVNANDNLGISKVEFYADGQLLGFSSVDPFNFKWSPVPGDHIIHVIAYDRARNTTTSQTVKVNIKK